MIVHASKLGFNLAVNDVHLGIKGLLESNSASVVTMEHAVQGIAGWTEEEGEMKLKRCVDDIAQELKSCIERVTQAEGLVATEQQNAVKGLLATTQHITETSDKLKDVEKQKNDAQKQVKEAQKKKEEFKKAADDLKNEKEGLERKKRDAEQNQTNAVTVRLRPAYVCTYLSLSNPCNLIRRRTGWFYPWCGFGVWFGWSIPRQTQRNGSSHSWVLGHQRAR